MFTTSVSRMNLTKQFHIVQKDKQICLDDLATHLGDE